MVQRVLPAYPLFVKDPYFSFWTKGEAPNEQPTMFWTGERKDLYGAVRLGEEVYSFLGDCAPLRAELRSRRLTAFTTDYVFEVGEGTLTLRFVSPLPPDDPALLMSPVCALTYALEGVEGEVLFGVRENVCYSENARDREVRGGSFPSAGGETAFFGLRRQAPLSHVRDAGGADWGHYYLSGERARYLSGGEAQALFLRLGCGENERVLVASGKGRGVFFFAFDDGGSADYFGTVLRACGDVPAEMERFRLDFPRILSRLDAFDADLFARAKKYGEGYYPLLVAALRQSVGAHKCLKDGNGELLFLSKECCSNGCIATVDVSYPSMPLYLLYGPELVRGMLRPILRFASLPVWKFGFAPHDCGTYPHCTGQVYGLRKGSEGDILFRKGDEPPFPFYLLPDGEGVYEFHDQMPVEESANVLIMLAACYRADGKLSLTEKYFPLLTRWADYLVRYGLHPFDQLCTDDFAGHLGNNLNLAIKAAVALGCFALLCEASGMGDGAKYRAEAERFAAEIAAERKGGALPLVYGAEGTFSLKYNLAFDRFLGLGLFSEELREGETDRYLAERNRFGTPLDPRKSYTKSDWIVWAASLTDDETKRRALLAPLNDYLAHTPDRIPFSDWYDSVTGATMGFRNRTVQGGCFALLLLDLFGVGS